MYRYLGFIVLALLGCSEPVECKDENCEEIMNAPATTVKIVPKKGWSQGQTLQPGIGGKKRAFQTDFPEAGSYTLQFNVDDLNGSGNLLAGDVVRARATIVWKVNGNPVQRIVDVGAGLSVSGVGEAVDVSLEDVSTTTAGTPISGRGIPYTITISSSPGVRAAVEQPPTIALPMIAIAPGGAVNFDVPKNSGAISTFVSIAPATAGSPIGAYQVLVQHSSIPGSFTKIYDPRQSDWVPLTPGTTTVTVFCDAALPVSTFVQVTFGIDG